MEETSEMKMSDEVRIGTVSYVALSLPGGKATFMEYARWSDDEKVKRMLEVWDEGTENERNQINLDELCKEVGIPGPELVGIVATQAMAHNRHAATALAAAAVQHKNRKE